MRIKFRSVIVSFLIVSFALSSCLDSDDNYEFSSDATIHAFGIDTIHGKHYKFTIDQLNRLIYNRDSLPVGSDTIIDRILIDTMTVTGWITSGSPTDTVFVMSDSVDLRPAMNNDAGIAIESSMLVNCLLVCSTIQPRLPNMNPKRIISPTVARFE